MSFPRYPAYKDSGVEWLGEVPEHWSLKPIKAVATCNDETLSESTVSDFEIDYIEISGVTEGRIVETSLMQFGNAPSRARRQLRHGDVLVSTVRTYLRAIAPVVAPPENLIASTGFAVIRPRAIDAGYMRYVFLAEYLIAEVIARSVGVSYPAVNASDLLRLHAPIPPEEEQRAIAAFLDRETAKIDALVAEQEKLIALLQEKRQAVISHAVTKGLDPDVPMKDSGVEWLGDVPAHWDVLKAAWIGTLFGSAQVPEEAVGQDGGIPFIKVGSMSDESFDIESWDWFVERSVAEQCSPRSDYLVFPKRGAAIFINKVNIVDRPSLIDPNLMGWEIGPDAAPKYVAYALKSRKLDELADVSTVPQINIKHIGPERFPVPPILEQRLIVNHLDHEGEKFRDLILACRRAIDLLKERRAALISAAVTGQIDVRRYGDREADISTAT